MRFDGSLGSRSRPQDRREPIRRRQHLFCRCGHVRLPEALEPSGGVFAFRLAHRFEDLRFGEIEDGTAVGTAIATAANRIKDSPAKSKVMILATDGANNRGDIDPLTAANAASELGIKIYTIGVGKEGKIPYPFEVVNPWTGQQSTQVQMIDSDLDEKSLQEIAKVTKGKYFRARNAEALEEIYSLIDKLEKTEIKTKSYTTYSDKFFPWLLAAAVVLMLEMLLAHTRFRRIP